MCRAVCFGTLRNTNHLSDALWPLEAWRLGDAMSRVAFVPRPESDRPVCNQLRVSKCSTFKLVRAARFGEMSLGWVELAGSGGRGERTMLAERVYAPPPPAVGPPSPEIGPSPD